MRPFWDVDFFLSPYLFPLKKLPIHTRSKQRWANSFLGTEYEYYSGSEIWLNTNTQIDWTIPNTDTNINREYTKTIKKQGILKLRTVKIAYWAICAFKYSRKFVILTWWNLYYLVFKLQPNTNTNDILGWKIMRIWMWIQIRIVFSYEYEY